MMTDWQEGLTQLPHHMREGMRMYLEFGVPSGSFMQAVLANDLMGAFGHADEINRHAMFEWCGFIYNYCPAQAHGSYEAVDRWIKHRGLQGLHEPAQEQEPDNAADSF